ncbi:MULTISPECIES: hypothetical protein [Acinetobacter]|uniref:hypothetical protein n=1 Tax=Acinetobacter TaxID=469 RepID=UPI000C441417|nr:MULTISPECIES: hypothetical protein [Acinetobacter]MBC68928.1 hypothetical protein [Acinetobacter sp.]MBT51757.1 hypothetical protein [Acinetobacter sp.]HIQ34131.1 hypothetical protein [Acinetobacter venetianus]HJP48215.1 hypothetical protein [Acinetobacter venetianus]|tara:strand:+ start:673 stop:1200 length:528 start_codon:yes stop_codon:yes gene_type:complete
MLKRINISTYHYHSVEIDGYVPFDIHFNEKSPDLYWRGGNGRTSLVEIGLLKTGELSTITLVSFSCHKLIQTGKNLFSSDLAQVYLPIFDVSYWSDDADDFSSRFKDAFDTEFQLFMGKNYIELVFLPLENTIEYVRDCNFSFGFNVNNELTSLQILNIDEVKMKLFRESLRFDS